MQRLNLSPRTEIFSGKRNFFKGGPKLSNRIPEWKMCVPFARFFYYFQAFWLGSHLILSYGKRSHPTEKFHSGFDGSHLLQLLTNQLFGVNGKQPSFSVS